MTRPGLLLLLAAPGCLFLGEADLEARIDGDGDGAIAAELGGDDCDDADPDVLPGAEDAPYDGVDTDCSGGSDDDADGDGLDAAFRGGPDCDDARPEVGSDPVDWFPDCDGDAAHTDVGTRSCGAPDDACAWSTLAGDDCDDADADVFPGRAEAWYDGVDADCRGDDDFDQDADGAAVPDDCDDTDPTVLPGAPEVWYDGVDGDCAGGDDFDQDADGVAVPDDCDDRDPDTFPGAPDPRYDGLDADCAGDDDFDADGDGASVAATPPDCDDADAAVFPGALDAWYDGVDADCAGDDDFDADADGWVPPLDCDDARGATHPGAADVPYDGKDTDCDGADDFDADRDGADIASDCDDAEPTVHPGAPDAWYDGVDADCDGANDFDADGDGAIVGVDCDDADPARAPQLPELPHDGVDSDCAGGDDFDVDRDGSRWPDDCDDLDPTRTPGRPEVWYDGIDSDCAGGDDFDADLDGAPLGPDCDDFDPAQRPGAPEVAYDGVDADCDGANDFDADGDGAVPPTWARFAGGTAPLAGDCDDADAGVGPLATEVWYDGADRNCDGRNDFDRDADGVVRLGDEAAAGGSAPVVGDCDDGDARISPLAPDPIYDGVDADCDGGPEFDGDGDGYEAVGLAPGGADCDDGDPAVNPGSIDVPGRDRNCDGLVSVDLDRDGVPESRDCDDRDAAVDVGGVVKLAAGDDPAALAARACAGTELAFSGGDWALTGPIPASRPLVLRGPGRLVAAPGARVVDAGADVVLDGLVLAGGDADEGGCLRVAPGVLATLTDVRFEGCTGVDGGAIWAGPGAIVDATDVAVTDAVADRGAAVFARLAALDLVRLDLRHGSARVGAGLDAVGGSVVLRDLRSTADGGAEVAVLALDGLSLTAAGVAVVDPVASAAAGAAVRLVDVSGSVDDLSLLGGALADDPAAAFVRVVGDAGGLAFERVTSSGTFGGVVFEALDAGGVTVHDVDLGFHTGPGCLRVTAAGTAGATTVDNLYVHNAAYAGPAGPCLFLSVVPPGRAVVRNATVVRTTMDTHALLFDGAELGSSLLGTSGWTDAIDYDPAADLHHVATLYGGDWWDVTTGVSGTPPGCATCTIDAADPFAVPFPGTSIALDPAHPLAAAGDPARCGPRAPATCLQPGYLGGPRPPDPR